MKEDIMVPYATGTTNTFTNGYTLNTYSADEMIKIFIAQCFDLGIKVAVKEFNISDNTDILKMLNSAYVRYVSSPCGQNLFGLAALIYKNENLISALRTAFTANIKDWSSKYLKFGTGHQYSSAEKKDILMNNYAIKSVIGNNCTESVCAFGESSKALLLIMMNPNDSEIKKLFQLIIASEPMTASDAEIALRALGENSDIYIDYYYATMLYFFTVHADFDSVLREVRSHYGL